MARYRIRFEALEPDVELDRELAEGVECDGYFMGLDQEDGALVLIDNMSAMDMAEIIFKNTAMIQAAAIAKGLEEAKAIKRIRTKENGLNTLAEKLRKMAESGE